MLSLSNFGSVSHPMCEKIRHATELVKRLAPSLIIDGEVMADTAVTPEILERDYPFSTLKWCECTDLSRPELRHPRLGLILLLDSYDRNLVVNAMRAGVRGLFCRASQPFRALCRCISVVFQGQYRANTEQMGYVIDALTSSPLTYVINAKGEGLLSPREEQVVNLVAEGIGNREVAQRLGIKENTVKKSLLWIYDKLDVSNRVELVLYALTHRGVEVSAPKRPPLSSPAEDCIESIQVRVGGIRLPVHSDN